VFSKRLVSALAVAAVLGGAAAYRLLADSDVSPRGPGGPVAVEVAEVERGAIELHRSFPGSLEARERFVVAAHVAGRVEKMRVELADPIEQGQVVAELDNDEESQGVAQASAELAVARANLVEARSALEIAERELQRIRGLAEQKVVSQSELDSARASTLGRQSAVKVAEARISRESAAFSRARVRSGYSQVVAAWDGAPDTRYVARRMVDEGDRVAPGDPVVSVVKLDPIDAVVFATERDYGLLAVGHEARVSADAYPGRIFEGTIRRIAPVFRTASRQARVEVEVDSPERLLKPGMFVRVEVVLKRAEDATIVPYSAITTRGGEKGVFVVAAAVDGGHAVSWQPVVLGIREGERIQIEGPGAGIRGRVVTLGQQLIDDGAAVVIPEAGSGAGSASSSAGSGGTKHSP
jgi:RND family efflux transporter MFP subunit